jgi:glyoxylase-like metal-dependent hydrolase (beta-lactamase superfamily II)
MREISDGVYQLEIPMRYNPLGYTYSYLLKDAAALIDTGVGTREALDSLSGQLRHAGVELSEIRHLIVTHLHGDHIGLMEQVRRISGATVVAHRRAVEVQHERLEKGGRIFDETRRELKLLGGGVYMNFLSGLGNRVRRTRSTFEIDETVEDGDLLPLESEELRIYLTPGHAQEHICLHDEKRRILFSGDHVLPKITPHISLHDPQGGDPLDDYLKALERIRGLPVKTVYPAHEHPFNDLDGRISELKLHHEMRCEEMKNAIRGGAGTVYEISSMVSWDSRPWPRMDFWTKRMAAAECLAHLVYMRNRDELHEETRKGVLQYSL